MKKLCILLNLGSPLVAFIIIFGGALAITLANSNAYLIWEQETDVCTQLGMLLFAMTLTIFNALIIGIGQFSRAKKELAQQPKKAILHVQYWLYRTYLWLSLVILVIATLWIVIQTVVSRETSLYTLHILSIAIGMFLGFITAEFFCYNGNYVTGTITIQNTINIKKE